MAVFKNYSFEYNAKSADVFKATVACITALEAFDFKEGCRALILTTPNFMELYLNPKSLVKVNI